MFYRGMNDSGYLAGSGWSLVACREGGPHTISALHCTQEIGAEGLRERRRVMPSLSPGWVVVHRGRGLILPSCPGWASARVTGVGNGILQKHLSDV